MTYVQTNRNTYKTIQNRYLLLAEPRRIRFTPLPPGGDSISIPACNRFGVVVVVVVVFVVVVVVGTPLDEEALE